MRGDRIGHYVEFIIKTFLIVNFVVGSLTHILALDQTSPLLESHMMLLNVAITGVFVVIETFRPE
jgi:hypothetical protein